MQLYQVGVQSGAMGVGHKRIQIHKALQNNQTAQGIRLDALLDCRICALQAAP